MTKVNTCLGDPNLIPSQKEIMVKFLNEIEASGLTASSMKGYAYVLRELALHLKKPFEEAEKTDIINFIQFSRQRLKDSSIQIFKAKVKRFYKWLDTGSLKGRKYPESVDWITNRGHMNSLPIHSKDDLVSEADIEKIIRAATGSMDKAFVVALWDSGCRIGELLGLNLDNVHFDQHGAYIVVSGKTGERRVRLVKSVPYLQRWINHHPVRMKKDAPLWVVYYKNVWRRMAYDTAFKKIKVSLPKRAGVKPRKPHLFRHNRATFLANHLTEAQMNQHFGWVQGSTVPRKYIHLSGRDIDPAILSVYGKREVKRAEPEKVLEPRICGRCNLENPGDASYCYGCGLALGEELTAEVETKARIHELVESILADDETLQKFIDKMK